MISTKLEKILNDKTDKQCKTKTFKESCKVIISKTNSAEHNFGFM